MVAFLIIGATSTNGTASASTIDTPQVPYSVSSVGFPVKIYNDAACTQYSGKTLATNNSDWQVIRQSTVPENGIKKFLAYDLGNNQWVKADEVFRGFNKVGAGVSYAYSRGQKVPVYDSPQLWHITGYLDPAISYWKVNSFTLYGPTNNNINRVNLGNNQWVDSTKNVDVIRTAMLFPDGTLTYNQDGQQTGAVSGNYDYYKIFGATTINGMTYVKLGSDNQWVKLSDGTMN
ncbi:hypothetical protein FC83_GL002314 [Agrilactobacillus composti DSM 18527 = JCM 14202]|uniref:Uncharacterized protein n=1 Tax=Agrilactobacillus composti DSM 18527 = JCM 14202 TaxID=1423734 RepID=A0A0R1Y0Y1_9LACO|nr:hypothetical protein FC83_GL002314 [Agrilactobacillus composti DSM 18527 = JCM 14202]